MEHLIRIATCCIALIGAFSAWPASLAAQEESAGPNQKILSKQVMAEHRTLSIGQYFNRWLQPPSLSEVWAKPERRDLSASAGAKGLNIASAFQVGGSRAALGSQGATMKETSSDLSDAFRSLQQLAGRRFDLAEKTNLYFGLGHEEDFGLLLKVNSR